MEKFLIYLIEASLSMTLLFGIYYLFLRKETYYNSNRAYLISSIIISLIIPLVKLDFTYVSNSINTYMIDPVTVYSAIKNTSVSNQISLLEIVFLVYLTGALLRVSLFIFRLSHLFRRKYQSQITKMSGFNLVIMTEKISPFSFLNNIFINEDQFHSSNLDNIIKHEFVHIKHRHSYDLIFMEIMSVLLWFNPLIILYKKSVKENHEFFADSQVIKLGINQFDYKKLLLDNVFNCQRCSLSNNLNCSPIKRRFLMMSKVKSRKVAKLKFLFSLPVIIAAVLLFSTTNASSISDGDENKVKFHRPTKELKSCSEVDLKNCNKIIIKKDCSEEELKKCREMAKKGCSPADLKKCKEGDKKCCTKKIIKCCDKGSKSKTCDVSSYDVPPKFGGDICKLLGEEIKYPKEAQKMGVEGTIQVKLDIDKKGKVTKTEIVDARFTNCMDKSKGHDYQKAFESFEKEALRVVKQLPDFTPAEDKGKTVKSTCIIPIMFKLQ